MRVSPLYPSSAPLHLRLSPMACCFQVPQGFQLLYQQHPLYQSFPYLTFPWMVLPLLGHSFTGLTIPPKGKWDHTPGDSPDHPHINRTCITCPEVEVGIEHNSIWGSEDMPNPTPETRTDYKQPQWESLSPFSSPTGGLAHPNDAVVAGSPKNTRDQVSSGSSLPRGSSVYSDQDTASEDCLSCLDTNEISMIMAHRKYRKRVRVSWKSCKGMDWTYS